MIKKQSMFMTIFYCESLYDEKIRKTSEFVDQYAKKAKIVLDK